MKEKRISFDVPEEIHTFLKIECARSHIALRDLMREITFRTVEDLKKKELHEMLNQGFQDVADGKTTKLTLSDLDQWERELDEI